ncbi:MAG: hypothetical protein RR381_00125 [Raoultibacter sp.]
MARKKQEYDWLDDPFSQSPQTKPKGFPVGLILVLAILLVLAVSVAVGVAYLTTFNAML